MTKENEEVPQVDKADGADDGRYLLLPPPKHADAAINAAMDAIIAKETPQEAALFKRIRERCAATAEHNAKIEGDRKAEEARRGLEQTYDREMNKTLDRISTQFSAHERLLDQLAAELREGKPVQYATDAQVKDSAARMIAKHRPALERLSVTEENAQDAGVRQKLEANQQRLAQMYQEGIGPMSQPADDWFTDATPRQLTAHLTTYEQRWELAQRMIARWTEWAYEAAGR